MSTPSDRTSAVQGQVSRAFLALVYVNAFVVGAVIMGFEMVGSRFLNPLFGSGIYTWAALISTVLASLTTGYFFGGWMADRKPTPAGLGWLIVLGSVYLALIPLFAEPLLEALTTMLGGIQDQREFERWGSILGAMLLLFVPLALLGVYSPYAIRLTLRATAQSGRVAGRIYGVSTLGSIFGTLFATFYLIPAMGSRNITYLLAAIALAAGLSFVLFRPGAVARLASAAAALMLAFAGAPERAAAETPAADAPRAHSAQATNEAANRFLAYVKKHGAEASFGAIEAGPAPDGFRILNLKIVGRDKGELRVATLEAATFTESEKGEASATGVSIIGVELVPPDTGTMKIARITAESLSWTAPPGAPRAAVKALAVRDVATDAPSGERVRIASIDVAEGRFAPSGGMLAGFALRSLDVTGRRENGSFAAIDVELIDVALPERIVVRNVGFRNFASDLSGRGTMKIASVDLRAFEMMNVGDRIPVDLRRIEFAMRGLEAPIGDGLDPAFERDMRAYGYTHVRMNSELVYRYEETGKVYNLARLEIDIAEAASATLALRIGGVSPDEIRQALRPPPPRPGQPPRGAQPGDAMAVAARFNLLSADFSFKDKSLIGRIIKRQAAQEQTDEAAIRTRYTAMLKALRDEQTDALTKEALDALLAFVENPGELVVEIRPPQPLNVVILATLATAKPEQLRTILGIKITAKAP